MDANPFRPGTVVEPEFFAGRSEEIALFNKALEDASNGNPTHLAILGGRGIGKTSLLRFLAFQAKNKKCMVARVDLDPGIATLDELTSLILSELKQAGVAYSLAEKGMRDFFEKLDVSIQILGAKVGVRKEPETESRLAFRKKLLEIWLNAKGRVPAIAMMIDEAEQLERIPGALQFLRNTFLRLSEERAAYLVVLSGKLNLFSEITELHSPLARFFRPARLDALNREETSQALEKPFKQASRLIEKGALEKIFEDSQGHPYVVQTIGYVLFDSGAKKIGAGEYETLRPSILRRLETQLFAELYAKSGPEERKILHLLSEKEPQTVKQLSEKMRRPANKFGALLARLVERGSITRIERGKYRLFQRLFAQYVSSQPKP